MGQCLSLLFPNAGVSHRRGLAKQVRQSKRLEPMTWLPFKGEIYSLGMIEEGLEGLDIGFALE